ncbi:unnamed protein product [Polarella glacialis]|uniref:Uncharacterized protein n=1 Tax=Polarella glacialis TaxID=89957 RepID=A0A813F2F6_POLGL|nr:unnamed protein product [Polarella glacialis]
MEPCRPALLINSSNSNNSNNNRPQTPNSPRGPRPPNSPRGQRPPSHLFGRRQNDGPSLNITRGSEDVRFQGRLAAATRFRARPSEISPSSEDRLAQSSSPRGGRNAVAPLDIEASLSPFGLSMLRAGRNSLSGGEVAPVVIERPAGWHRMLVLPSPRARISNTGLGSTDDDKQPEREIARTKPEIARRCGSDGQAPAPLASPLVRRRLDPNRFSNEPSGQARVPVQASNTTGGDTTSADSADASAEVLPVAPQPKTISQEPILGAGLSERPEAMPDAGWRRAESRKDADLSESPEAASECLAEALLCLGAGLPLHGLSEQEREEALELERAIGEHHLTDRRALAYILVYKLGSLEKAFQWLAATRATFARVTWETGMLILHINVEHLTGLSKQKSFAELDQSSVSSVSSKDWQEYFAGIEVGLPPLPPGRAKFLMGAERTRAASSTAAARSLGALPRMAIPKSSVRGVCKTVIAEEEVEPKAVIAEECDVAVLASSQEEAAAATSSDTEEDSEPTPVKVPIPPRNRLSISGPSAGAVPASPTASRNVDSWGKARALLRRRRASAPSITLPPGSGGSLRPFNRRRASMASSMPAEDPQEDLEIFQATIRLEMEGMSPDGHLSLEGISRAKRAVVIKVAQELGIWIGISGQALLVVREGDGARQVRETLDSVTVGACLRVPLPADPGMQLFAKALAESKGLLAVSEPDANCSEAAEGGPPPVASFLLVNCTGSEEDLMDGLRRELQGLAPGEIKRFPASASAAFRSAASKVAQSLGFEVALPMIKSGCLEIGNMLEFAMQVKQELEALAEGDEHNYGSALEPLHKIIIQRKSLESELQILDIDNDVVVRRQNLGPTGPTQAELNQQLDQQRKVKEGFFRNYASGGSGAEVFLRRRDLHPMVNGTFSQAPDGQVAEGDLLRSIEQVFDDTLQLQIDMTHAGQGLSKQYFQVFLGKAATEAGWRPSPEAMEVLSNAVDSAVGAS